jgi:4-amino-4-deoxy-L-arabinose transferase-like glycosyltransferase
MVTRLRAWSTRSLASTHTDARWVWAAVAVFVLVSLWWLTQDSRVPDFDSGLHMSYAITYHYYLAHGQFTAPWTDYNSYPPLVHLLGAVSILVAGAHPMAMVLASNIVFVPILAFGCYGSGKLVAGPRAGLLAALVGLGTPMFVSMMHVYDLDPPQAAMVAVTVWALLASRRFERIWVSALAGALFGLALLTKETSVVFITGLLVVILVRGGWRRWPGLVAFIIVLENVAGPWYMYHATQLVASFTSLGQLAPNSVQAPPRFSAANIGWYLWNLVNEQTLAVFGALFFIGALIALWRCARERISTTNLYPELLGGALVSYLGMTYLTHKDPRYTLPALVYVAVLGTSWIVRIRRPAFRRLLTSAVVVLCVVYFVGMSFGIGGAVRLALPGSQNTLIYQRQLTLYETAGWVRGGPATDGHVLALLESLRRSGVNAINLFTGSNELDFNANGVAALASSADVYVAPSALVPSRQTAFVFVHTPRPGDPRPCQTLNDGVGIYVARGDFSGLDPQTLNNPAKPSQRFLFVCPA